jgi:hypothetical protein
MYTPVVYPESSVGQCKEARVECVREIVPPLQYSSGV